MAIQKALETLCYVNGCGSVAIESAQIHVPREYYTSAFWFLGTWVKFDPKKVPRTLNGHNFRPSMTHEV